MKNVHSYLSKIEPRSIKEKYNPKELKKNEIYPNSWGEEDYDYLVGYFEELKDFR